MKSGSSDISDFAAKFSILGDDELLAILAQREKLVGSAVMALDTEVARRQLNRAQKVEQAGEIKTSVNAELPYHWGRFVGGMTVVGALLSGAADLVRKDFIGGAIAAGAVFLGFGIYNMRKWAVLLMEIGTCLSSIVVAILLLNSGLATAEILVGILAIVIFNVPQTIYFWKRRKQLR